MKVQEHPIQTVFALLQSVMIVSGVLTTRALMKATGYPDSGLHWHSFPIFVRSWGFCLLFIPVVWVFVSLWLEESFSHIYSRRWSLVSGFLLLIALTLMFVFSAIMASRAGGIMQSI